MHSLSGKHRLFVWLCYVFLLIQSLSVKAQTSAPKREFRAVWIATVANIDWPSQRNLSSLEQQAEYRAILDEHQKNGMNAIVVQVRPATDAFYRSSREPWSEWLTGKQGREPYPLYDPLAFMVEESHRRGMEFHAWFNPYRATFATSDTNLIADHITRRQPTWFMTYGGKKLFNPGLPEVRQYITQVILEVVRNYDIDAVHFDDYFYPYQIVGQTLNDNNTFATYGKAFNQKDDWRRHNVNLLIQMVHDSIQAIKPYVKFGISPFGVWRNRSDDPRGSVTTGGLSSYAHLYADSREWVRQGWIDYIAPQIYFSTQSHLIPYKNLLEWWAQNACGKHLYIGQAAYKINVAGDDAWANASQTPTQLRQNRSLPQVNGSIYFSSKSLLNNPNHIQDSLRATFYRYPALIPAMPWKDSVPPLPPQDLDAHAYPEGIRLDWLSPAVASDGDAAHYFIIYRFLKGQKLNIEDPSHILAIHRESTTTYMDSTALDGEHYIYVITSADRLHNESAVVAKVKCTMRKSRGRRQQ